MGQELSGPRRSVRSRRAERVGDAAGEGGDRAVAYDAFNRRDLSSLPPLIHPDFEVDLTKSMGFDRARYAGLDGLKKLFESYWDSFESIVIELEECIESQDAVVAIIRARGRGLGSGIEVEARGPHVWSFREGRVVRVALHEHLSDALEAAGLSE